MFLTYLRRELGNRKRQTLIVSAGMAMAIGLVIVVSSLAAGIRAAQDLVLQSMYGIGTDITISQPTQPGSGAARLDFPTDRREPGSGASQELHEVRLAPRPGSETIDSSTLSSIEQLDGIADLTGVLTLSNTTLSGSIPDLSESRDGGEEQRDQGSFSIDSFTVMGTEPGQTTVGPLAATAMSSGRPFDAGDAGSHVAILDDSYATAAGAKIGDQISIGQVPFDIVGIVTSSSSDVTTASDAYVPLDVAQKLTGLEGRLSTVYVQAASADQIPELQSNLEAAMPDAVVQTQDDLATTVHGSLGAAAGLAASLGTWLSLLVLLAAFLNAILFTVSSVGRRTRELGTLKAIGWSNARITRQIAGESMSQSLLGAVVGVLLAVATLMTLNALSLTLETTPQPTTRPDLGAVAQRGRDKLAELMAEPGSEIVLHAPIALPMILIAVALAIVGGVLAGTFGGWRAVRLRPTDALRSVA